MELIGKWKIKKILCITENGMDMIAPEELPETEDYDDYRIMCRAIFDFNADGMVYQLLRRRISRCAIRARSCVCMTAWQSPKSILGKRKAIRISAIPAWRAISAEKRLTHTRCSSWMRTDVCRRWAA